ncbi:MAG: hypothetical protein ABFD79_13600 [Phycisphaerales bacterium]
MVRGRLSLIGVIILGGVFAGAYANEIAINDIAVWSQGSIDLGSGVVINGISASGTAFNANGGSKVNSIYTQGSVWLGSNSVVNGSIYANGSIETYGVNVTGTKNSNWNFSLPQLDALANTMVGQTSIYKSKNSTSTLNPGNYSEWNFGQKNQLNLSAGSYSIRSFYMNRSGVVNVDTSAGDVVLNVNGSFSTGNNVVFNKTGNGNFYVNVINSNMSLGNDVSLSGIVHISGGTFNTGTSVNMTGQLFSTGDIWFGNNSQYTYQTAASIPEPATAAIFAIASMLLINRRKATRGTKAAA